MYQTLHNNNTTWGNANELHSNSIFATLEKKRVHDIQENPEKWLTGQNQQILLEALKSKILMRVEAFVALKQHHDFDINFSDINDIRTVCQRSIFAQKLQILEELEKWSTFIFVSKLTIFSGKKFEKFEFSCLNWSKIVISCFDLGNFRSKSQWFFGLKVPIFDSF